MGRDEAAREDMAELCRAQAKLCAQLGSDLYTGLLWHCAEDVEAGGPVWTVLRDLAGCPEEFYPALRLLGSVHRLVLDGRAPALEAHYPSAGGRPGPGVWEAFRDTVARHAGTLSSLVRNPPQTNEVGRAASLLGGFLQVARETGLPLRLLEVGASAGLNLAWDRYRYESGTWSWGDPSSPLRITGIFDAPPAAGTPAAPATSAIPPATPDAATPATSAIPTATPAAPDAAARAIPTAPPSAVPAAPDIDVVERLGCDLRPIDLGTEDGRLTLLSYVWPDQIERIARLRAAIEVAGGVRPRVRVEEASAVEWLRRQLAAVRPGVATVVFHSIVLSYFDDAERRVFAHVISDAGSRATADAPLAWLALERSGDRFEVRLRSWPSGEERLLGLAGGHGLPVRWLASRS